MSSFTAASSCVCLEDGVVSLINGVSMAVCDAEWGEESVDASSSEK